MGHVEEGGTEASHGPRRRRRERLRPVMGHVEEGGRD